MKQVFAVVWAWWRSKSPAIVVFFDRVQDVFFHFPPLSPGNRHCLDYWIGVEIEDTKTGIVLYGIIGILIILVFSDVPSIVLLVSAIESYFLARSIFYWVRLRRFRKSLIRIGKVFARIEKLLGRLSLREYDIVQSYCKEVYDELDAFPLSAGDLSHETEFLVRARALRATITCVWKFWKDRRKIVEATSSSLTEQ